MALTSVRTVYLLPNWRNQTLNSRHGTPLTTNIRKAGTDMISRAHQVERGNKKLLYSQTRAQCIGLVIVCERYYDRYRLEVWSCRHPVNEHYLTRLALADPESYIGPQESSTHGFRRTNLPRAFGETTKYVLEPQPQRSTTHVTYANLPGTNGCPALRPPHTGSACPFT